MQNSNVIEPVRPHSINFDIDSLNKNHIDLSFIFTL